MFMSPDLLAHLWYFVIGISVTFYVVLDGFDLGVGCLHLFTKKDEERRIFLNAIGPVWDGNEVWLVIVGGALFAGFPDVYATLFSGFYDLCMALLAALIFRAVAIEFRSKGPSNRWRSTWDRVFSCASILIALGLGLTLGNLMEGIPLDVNRDFTGSFDVFLRPYPVLIALFTLSLLSMHGSIYLAMKTEGALHRKVRIWAKGCITLFLLMFLVTTIATWIFMPKMTDRFLEEPWYFFVPLASVLSILAVPKAFAKNADGWAFLFSSFSILFLFGVFGIATYPNLVVSSVDPKNNSLTLFNAAASPLTLKVLLLIVAIGVPLVLAYGALIYRVFRGKVKLGPTSY
jgi:cytochrome d ubiquinol oxidase subunit II